MKRLNKWIIADLISSNDDVFEEALDRWKGALDQLDDLCVIGFRV